jgi:hypothetical protein
LGKGYLVSPVKTFFIGTIVLFGAILGVAAWKKRPAPAPTPQIATAPSEPSREVPQEVAIQVLPPAPPKPVPAPITPPPAPSTPAVTAIPDTFPEIDQIERLFTLDPARRLPIVETVSFTSRVPWLKGRPAWVADYASYYETSRHFIARCLNHGPDYFSQKVTPGARFNVFRKEASIEFHLVADLSKCRMLFYYTDAGEKVLLKTYPIAVGRADSTQASGSLTPLGKYSLGSRVAIYKLGSMGVFRDQKTEMIQIFGTRWLPFDKEIEGCTKKAKGFGLHGAPWVPDANTGQLVEDRGQIGGKNTDGSIWLLQEDVEEIFAIVLTKPTFVEIVKEQHD